MYIGQLTVEHGNRVQKRRRVSKLEYIVFLKAFLDGDWSSGSSQKGLDAALDMWL